MTRRLERAARGNSHHGRRSASTVMREEKIAMIDRAARNRAVLLIRRLAGGRITNDEFEDALPRSQIDPAMDEVFLGGIWGMYTDLYEHRLTGRDRLPRTARREIAKYILFLKSDREYEWPCPTLWQHLLWLGAGILTLGLAGHLYRRRMRFRGDLDVWPFLRRQDFERALEKPCYLAARA